MKERINRPTFFASGWVKDLLSIAAGIIMTFAFAPFKLYLCAVIAPIILYALWQHTSPRIAFKRGWLFGLGMFGSGVYWVFISIHTFGNASIWLAGFFTIGFIAILALFTGVTGYLLNRYFPNEIRARLFYAFPAIWVFFEWVRSFILTGFPWLLLGSSQVNSPLIGFAPLIGVYGLSLLVLFSSGLIIQICREIKHKNSRKNYKNSLSYMLALIALWSAGAYLTTFTWTKPFGKPIKVSLVQGNIPQEIKWSAESVQTSLDTYSELTKPYWNSRIIIWPESAITIPLQNAADFLNDMDATATKHQAAFITGVPVKVEDTQSYYNAVIALGNGKGFYFKRRLVPFGEFTPFHQQLNKLLDILKIPMSDFIPANDKPPIPLQVDNLKISVFICYEIAFPELVLSQDDTINAFLTVSNDAWFGRSIAQAQHLEMAQLRAAENGRPILFVSNNGLTAFINPKGQIQSAAPPYVPFVLTDMLQPVVGNTPLQKIGIDPELFLIFMLIVFSIREQWIFKRQQKNIKK